MQLKESYFQPGLLIYHIISLLSAAFAYSFNIPFRNIAVVIPNLLAILYSDTRC